MKLLPKVEAYIHTLRASSSQTYTPVAGSSHNNLNNHNTSASSDQRQNCSINTTTSKRTMPMTIATTSATDTTPLPCAWGERLDWIGASYLLLILHKLLEDCFVRIAIYEVNYDSYHFSQHSFVQSIAVNIMNHNNQSNNNTTNDNNKSNNSTSNNINNSCISEKSTLQLIYSYFIDQITNTCDITLAISNLHLLQELMSFNMMLQSICVSLSWKLLTTLFTDQSITNESIDCFYLYNIASTSSSNNNNSYNNRPNNHEVEILNGYDPIIKDIMLRITRFNALHCLLNYIILYRNNADNNTSNLSSAVTVSTSYIKKVLQSVVAWVVAIEHRFCKYKREFDMTNSDIHNNTSNTSANVLNSSRKRFPVYLDQTWYFYLNWWVLSMTSQTDNNNNNNNNNEVNRRHEVVYGMIYLLNEIFQNGLFSTNHYKTTAVNTNKRRHRFRSKNGSNRSKKRDNRYKNNDDDDEEEDSESCDDDDSNNSSNINDDDKNNNSDSDDIDDNSDDDEEESKNGKDLYTHNSDKNHNNDYVNHIQQKYLSHSSSSSSFSSQQAAVIPSLLPHLSSDLTDVEGHLCMILATIPSLILCATPTPASTSTATHMTPISLGMAPSAQSNSHALSGIDSYQPHNEGYLESQQVGLGPYADFGKACSVFLSVLRVYESILLNEINTKFSNTKLNQTNRTNNSHTTVNTTRSIQFMLQTLPMIIRLCRVSAQVIDIMLNDFMIWRSTQTQTNTNTNTKVTKNSHTTASDPDWGSLEYFISAIEQSLYTYHAILSFIQLLQNSFIQSKKSNSNNSNSNSNKKHDRNNIFQYFKEYKGFIPKNVESSLSSLQLLIEQNIDKLKSLAIVNSIQIDCEFETINIDHKNKKYKSFYDDSSSNLSSSSSSLYHDYVPEYNFPLHEVNTSSSINKINKKCILTSIEEKQQSEWENGIESFLYNNNMILSNFGQSVHKDDYDYDDNMSHHLSRPARTTTTGDHDNTSRKSEIIIGTPIKERLSSAPSSPFFTVLASPFKSKNKGIQGWGLYDKQQVTCHNLNADTKVTSNNYGSSCSTTTTTNQNSGFETDNDDD